MSKCYYIYDTSLCQAYVQEITYFFFWRRWYWKASFYHHEEFLPCDCYDGFEKTEEEAIDAIHERYDELIGELTNG